MLYSCYQDMGCFKLDKIGPVYHEASGEMDRASEVSTEMAPVSPCWHTLPEKTHAISWP